jgi:hypothetical protein
MGRRKGELSPSAIDGEWPYQISLLADDCTGSNYYTVNLFADALSVCTRGHSCCHDDRWHRVFCFKEKADAEKFQARFGGEWFDPARRGRGRRWAQLREPKKRFY